MALWAFLMYISVLPEPVTPWSSTGFLQENAACIFEFADSWALLRLISFVGRLSGVWVLCPSFTLFSAAARASEAVSSSWRIFSASSSSFVHAFVPGFVFSASGRFYSSLSLRRVIFRRIDSSTFSFLCSDLAIAAACASSRLTLLIG